MNLSVLWGASGLIADLFLAFFLVRTAECILGITACCTSVLLLLYSLQVLNDCLFDWPLNSHEYIYFHLNHSNSSLRLLVRRETWRIVSSDKKRTKIGKQKALYYTQQPSGIHIQVI